MLIDYIYIDSETYYAMVPTKKSDRIIGFIAILQALLMIWMAYDQIEDAKELQVFGSDAKIDFRETTGCTDDSEDELCQIALEDFDGLIDELKSDVVTWQVLYAFAGILSVVFLLVSIRLMTGTEILLNSLFTNQNRSLYFYSTLVMIIVGYILGMYEASMMNNLSENFYTVLDSYGLEEGVDYDKDPEFKVLDTDGGFWAIANCVFLVFNGLIALLTLGSIKGAETLESDEFNTDTENDNMQINKKQENNLSDDSEPDEEA